MCKFWVIDFFIRLAFPGLHISTANDGQLEISQVEDPSGMWSSFIAEEGSLDRAQRIVHYLCQRERERGGGGGEGVAKRGLVTFLIGRRGWRG